MKRLFALLMVTAIHSSLNAGAAIQGDINNDGRIDTSEAIFALQVAAGLYPGVSTSCLLSGKGDWSTSTAYVACDVVSFGGDNYVCKTSHPSSSGDFGDDAAYWDLLTLKGEKGDPGSLGPGAIISGSVEAGLTVYNASTGGSHAGLLGQMTSTSQGSFSTGVRGINNGTSGNGIGVWGSQDGGGWGVYGTSNDGRGVYGRAFNTGGVGVYGLHDDSEGTKPGVYGETDSTEAYAAGVIGKVDSASPGSYSAGVRGINDGTGGAGIGVWGSQDGSGWGVYGETQTGRGVYGKALGTTNTNYGIYGRTESDIGYAGYFYGRVYVNGILAKAAGTFKIDHPLDPENQYLYHSFVESPDMKNIYDGVVTLENDGNAWVELPDWFEALNQDFRYQLTPIGAPMPGLYIAQEVQNNRFEIAGGKPGMKVSWQMTGIRHDPYAEQNRILVEEKKPPAEQGTYLYPQGYNQPESMGLDYLPD